MRHTMIEDFEHFCVYSGAWKMPPDILRLMLRAFNAAHDKALPLDEVGEDLALDELLRQHPVWGKGKHEAAS